MKDAKMNFADMKISFYYLSFHTYLHVQSHAIHKSGPDLSDILLYVRATDTVELI